VGAVGQCDPRAGLGEGEGDRRPDADAAAGDESRASGELRAGDGLSLLSVLISDVPNA
jgi:hypothetical protein